MSQTSLYNWTLMQGKFKRRVLNIDICKGSYAKTCCILNGKIRMHDPYTWSTDEDADTLSLSALHPKCNTENATDFHAGRKNKDPFPGLNHV